jgi:DNA-binding MarR family transcriptional regulator
VAKERCSSDARVTYAVLTEAGVKKIEAARESHLADVEELFGAQFSAEEREQLAELLGRLPLAHTSEACSA